MTCEYPTFCDLLLKHLVTAHSTDTKGRQPQNKLYIRLMLLLCCKGTGLGLNQAGKLAGHQSACIQTFSSPLSANLQWQAFFSLPAQQKLKDHFAQFISHLCKHFVSSQRRTEQQQHAKLASKMLCTSHGYTIGFISLSQWVLCALNTGKRFCLSPFGVEKVHARLHFINFSPAHVLKPNPHSYI